jgi:MraZ protein
VEKSGLNVHFQGGQLISLDAKGRLAVPTRYRDTLNAVCQGQMTLTRHPDGCLLLYPRSVWHQRRDKLAALPVGARDWVRILVGDAEDVEMDGAGRVLVPPYLKGLAGLDKEVSFKGMNDGFEIWNTEKLALREQQTLAAGTPEIIANLTL